MPCVNKDAMNKLNIKTPIKASHKTFQNWKLTSSGWSFRSWTSFSIALKDWKRWTFSLEMAHFQMAPVADARSSLLS